MTQRWQRDSVQLTMIPARARPVSFSLSGTLCISGALRQAQPSSGPLNRNLYCFRMKRLTTIAGIAISGILLWLAVKDADFRAIVSAFRGANLAYSAPILVVLAAFYYLKAMRWSNILSSTASLPGHKLVPAMMSGAAGNNLLPAHIGELVRVYLASREFQLSKANVLATLMVERIFDIVGVLLLLSVALTFADVSPTLLPAILLLLATALTGSVVMYLMTFHVEWFERVAEVLSRPFPVPMRNRLASFARHLALGFGVLRTRGHFGRIFANSILQWILMSCCIYLALQPFSEVPFHAAIIVLAITVAGLTLPTSPGFVGTIQFCFVFGLTPFGVDPSKALAASIFYHTLLWTSVTATGLYFLHKYRVSFAQLKEREQQAAAAGPDSPVT